MAEKIVGIEKMVSLNKLSEKITNPKSLELEKK